MATFQPNTLYYGDNLSVLRDFPDACVDLVYLDPPFNSARAYNVLFKEAKGAESEAQIEAFGDTWKWGQHANETYDEVVSRGDDVGRLLQSFVQTLGHNDVTAYLTMMAPRLVELRGVMKPAASIYLHCDPTASHYLKVLMDAVFRPDNFKNEIIWQRFGSHNDSRRFGRITDTLLYYSISDKYTFNPIFTGYSDDHLNKRFRHTDPDGRKFWPNTMLAPGGRGPQYTWNGHTRNWRFTEDNMRALDATGQIYYSDSGMPYRKTTSTNYPDSLSRTSGRTST